MNTEDQSVGTDTQRRPKRRRPDERPPRYDYDRELIAPLLARAGLTQPVLRLTGEDLLWVSRHLSEGAWSTGMQEHELPQFQQEPAHTAFCERYYEEERDVS